jgi:hypothetical protein
MRLAILLASVTLATPALAGGSGYPPAQKPKPGYNGCGNGSPQCGYAPKPGKPPKLVYEPAPPNWQAPPKHSVGYVSNANHNQNSNYNQNSNANSNWNSNSNNNSNSNRNRNSARAGASAGATAGASATGGTASIGDVSTGPSTATASNSNSNNADNSANLSSNVRVEGDTYIQARNRRIPVSTAYAAPLTSGIDTCLGSASAGVQTGILGVSLGGTKRDRICETIKLSRELHHMGMREGAVQLLCNDPRVRIAMRNAGTPCEAVTYAPPPMVYDEPPPRFVPAPPPRVRKRGERG